MSIKQGFAVGGGFKQPLLFRLSANVFQKAYLAIAAYCGLARAAAQVASLGWSPAIATNVSQIYQLGARPEVYRVHLEAVVCWANSTERLLALQDATGTALFELDTNGQSIRSGNTVVLDGDCTAKGVLFHLAQGLVVDNDGLHGMEERSGSRSLRTGKLSIRVLWFDRAGDFGLEVYYQGPGIPRQRIPSTALFHSAVANLASAPNWVNGPNYQCYEGRWDHLPQFSELTPVSRGTAANFDLRMLSRTNYVGLEFTGVIEVPRDGVYTFYLVSDDGSQLFLDEQALGMEVIQTNAPFVTRKLLPGQGLAEQDDCSWCEVDGKVTFIGKKPDRWELELATETGHMVVVIPVASEAPSPFLLQSEVRAAGVCQVVSTEDGRKVAGRLMVPNLEQVRILNIAPRYWSAYPEALLGAVLRTNLDQEMENVCHVRGTIAAVLGEHSIILHAASGDVFVETSQNIKEAPGKWIEVLGQQRQAGTNTIVKGSFYRTVANAKMKSSEILPVLTTIEEVHRLKPEDAGRHYPVLVQGVITCTWSDSGTIQDSTRGVFVPGLFSRQQERPQTGDLLEVEGVTKASDFAPLIEPRRVTRLGRGRLPVPLRPSWDQLMTGSLDCQYVELDGIVTSIETSGVTLLLGEGKIQVLLDDFVYAELHHLENARVRIRGVLTAAWDAKTRQVIGDKVTMNAASVEVCEPRPQDLFSARTKKVAELLQFDSQGGAFQRVKFAGQIVHKRNREYYLMDGTNGLRFVLKRGNELDVGDEVELSGFPRRDGPSPVVYEATARKTGRAPLPRAQQIPSELLLSSRYDATLVELEARLLSVRSSDAGAELELQTGPRRYLARLSSNPEGMAPMRIGSRLKLIGVYSGQGGKRMTGHEFDSFELLLNSPGDIAVLERPSWWTSTRTLTVLCALCVGLILAGTWIASLRRQVEQRTRELRTEIKERARTQEQLLQASRRAGMAEVASNVLHNVGNVLNSVNVSANLLDERVRRSRSSDLHRLVNLLSEHAADLGAFFAKDPRAQKVPDFLSQLAARLGAEQALALSELTLLRENIEHVKEIVAMQQNHTKVSGVIEQIELTELVEDALRMDTAALAQHDVEVIREFEPVPPICTDRHKVLQILVNLIRNAKHACDESGSPDKKVTMRITNAPDVATISVTDNGVGVPVENLTRIFNHGFTLRKDGHGFGLHSGALAAKELGGSLSVKSGGPGKGATFTLVLPKTTTSITAKV